MALRANHCSSSITNGNGWINFTARQVGTTAAKALDRQVKVIPEQQTSGCVVSFRDQGIEECSTSLHGFDLDFRQLEGGRFRSRTSVIDLGGLRLQRRTLSLRSAMWGSAPPELILILPLNPRPLFLQDTAIGTDIQLVSAGTKYCCAILPAGYDHLLVCVSEQELLRCLGITQTAWLLGHARRMEHCFINTQRKLTLTRRLYGIYSGILYGSKAPDAEQCRLYREEIVGLLHDYLQAHPDPQRKLPGTQERLLHRALLLIEGRPAHAFSLDELSREAYASKRAIQYAFEDLVGLSPLRYIKMNRLNMIRKALAAGSELSLGSLVSKFGFSNQGRLMREYTELFGEKPRDTRRSGTNIIRPAMPGAPGRQEAVHP